jgi:hypothetical protein
MFAQLGPWAFPVVAAMVAVIAALGFKGGKGGGGSAPASARRRPGPRRVPEPCSAIQRQERQHRQQPGACREEHEQGSGIFERRCCARCKSIDQNIGALAAQVAKELNVGGAFDTTGKVGTSSARASSGCSARPRPRASTIRASVRLDHAGRRDRQRRQRLDLSDHRKRQEEQRLPRNRRRHQHQAIPPPQAGARPGDQPSGRARARLLA